RLEVMRELESFPELKRNKKSWETINLYAPLAHKLGLYVIKSEMEDLSLKYLETKDYNSIQKKLADSEHERREFIEKFKAPIIEKLDSLGLNYKLKSRTKSIYSIWRKMHQQNVNFEGVYDVFAVRIIIDCEAEFEKMHCWTAFSVVTDFYLPNPDRMRDWISIPKSNGYESLHATVLVDKLATPPRWVEVQIRSQRMDEVAERGVAAHWRYKGNSAGNITSEQWLERLRSVVESTDGASAALKEEFDLTQGTSEVFVFTPTGDIRKLPEGATLLDFAFDIHTNVGAACTGGRINGRNVSIREMLRSGDIAEVVTSKNQKAKADWLNFVVTNKAKGKIKQILREAQANSSILGREELERKVKNWKIPLTVEECVNYLSKYFKVRTGMEVYTAIAQGRVPMIEIKEFLQKAYEGTLPAGVAKPRKEPAERKTDSQDMMIIDNGLAQVDYKLGNC
ncbi:MAG: TGS domain-containing protein, partial [Mucinivorans sp.]